ncbi:MAG: DUF2141 domain-containing protein [Sphingomonadaceae bacterium]
MTQHLFLAACLGIATAATPAPQATVTVHVENVRAAPGPLYLSLQKEAEFMQNRGSYGAVLAEPETGTATLVIADVAPGEYAPVVWHDDNGNGAFDMGEDNRPLDGWSMVGARQLTGEPRFEEVRIVVDEARETVELEMVYGRGQ